MNIKESIIHYIGVYDGSEKRVIENTVSDHIYEFKKQSDARQAVESNIFWLVENKYIQVVRYQDMTDSEKRYYESDGYCTIYRIVRRYNESEYLKEKYSEKN